MFLIGCTAMGILAQDIVSPSRGLLSRHYKDAVYRKRRDGKETFEVQLKVSADDSKILSGAIQNLIATRGRECRDTALTRAAGSAPAS